jgi:hypothetical protein
VALVDGQVHGQPSDDPAEELGHLARHVVEHPLLCETQWQIYYLSMYVLTNVGTCRCNPITAYHMYVCMYVIPVEQKLTYVGISHECTWLHPRTYVCSVIGTKIHTQV